MDIPVTPGLVLTPTGATFRVYASSATAVWLCLFTTDASGHEHEERIPLEHRVHGWWFADVPGVVAGTHYGVRADGPWDPVHGHRHNPHKLLMDPYAKALKYRTEHGVNYHPAVFAHQQHPDGSSDLDVRSEEDSAAQVPRCVAIDDGFDWSFDGQPEIRPPRRRLSDCVIYEAHVRDMTRLHPAIPPPLRGTYAGMAHPAMIEHLRTLGITTIELLPIHAFVSEPALSDRGLVNHWGYNTLGFFAPHPSYAATSDPQGVVDEVKGMIKLLHAAGLEVILDVVYNHTAEQSIAGACLSWRGLDAPTYYRLDDAGRDVDVTGCGNSVNTAAPVTMQLVLDSLRRWASDFHVDGFRFDLAVTLGRNVGHEFDPHHPLLLAMAADPLLRGMRLIAEPWDVGTNGWRTGQFPPPWSEWNDRYRDTVRSFWLTDHAKEIAGESAYGHGVGGIATQLAGSKDLFGTADRTPTASINFVTAHDGFTLADLTSYATKHNEANREGNADGANSNRSYNFGVDGPTTVPAIQRQRQQAQRNLLAVLLFSHGVPMLAAGSEIGRTAAGNNNPYCQDNELSWLDWQLSSAEQDLLATTAELTHLRRLYRGLRRPLFGSPTGASSAQMAWFDNNGQPMHEQWNDPTCRTLQWATIPPTPSPTDPILLVVLHGGAYAGQTTLPQLEQVRAWRRLWDSAWDRPLTEPLVVTPGTATEQAAFSVRLYAAQ